MKKNNPKNMTRVLCFFSNNTLGFALYKDGMYKADGSKSWIQPFKVLDWFSVEEVKEVLKSKNPITE